MYKDSILELREQGWSYNQISEHLGCSKGTISYHVGVGQKEKTYQRLMGNDNRRLWKRVNNFQSKKRSEWQAGGSSGRKKVSVKVAHFQKVSEEDKFTTQDVLDHFGENTHCYLTGEAINLYESDYHFDHITPIVKGGDNTIQNLGICLPEVNQAKGALSVDEFISLCETVLRYNKPELFNEA